MNRLSREKPSQAAHPLEQLGAFSRRRPVERPGRAATVQDPSSSREFGQVAPDAAQPLGAELEDDVTPGDFARQVPPG